MEKPLWGWKRAFSRAHGLIADLFARSEPRVRSLAYLQGLLSGCERKNGWQLAEWMGEAAPYAVQHLLDRARRDADEVRDRMRSYALEELSSAEAVLVQVNQGEGRAKSLAVLPDAPVTTTVQNQGPTRVQNQVNLSEFRGLCMS